MRERELLKDNRGISGVVVAILLTVIGIAGVVILWTVILPMFYRIDFEILEVKLIDVATGDDIVQIKIWNTGGIDITKLTLTGEGDLKLGPILGKDEVLKAGDQRTFVIKTTVNAPTTYTIIIKAEGNAPFGGSRETSKAIRATAVKD